MISNTSHHETHLPMIGFEQLNGVHDDSFFVTYLVLYIDPNSMQQ